MFFSLWLCTLKLKRFVEFNTFFIYYKVILCSLLTLTNYLPLNSQFSILNSIRPLSSLSAPLPPDKLWADLRLPPTTHHIPPITYHQPPTTARIKFIEFSINLILATPWHFYFISLYYNFPNRNVRFLIT